MKVQDLLTYYYYWILCAKAIVMFFYLIYYFCNSLFVLGCFFCMVSLMGLVYARYADLEKNRKVFLYSIVLSIVVCLSGLILIKCGLDGTFEGYVLCGTSSTEPTGG